MFFADSVSRRILPRSFIADLIKLNSHFLMTSLINFKNIQGNSYEIKFFRKQLSHFILYFCHQISNSGVSQLLSTIINTVEGVNAHT
jgi:hypothetical protein